MKHFVVTCSVIFFIALNFTSCSCETSVEEFHLQSKTYIDDEWFYVESIKTTHKQCASISGGSGGSTKKRHELLRYRGDKPERHEVGGIISKALGQEGWSVNGIDHSFTGDLFAYKQASRDRIISLNALLLNPKSRKVVYSAQDVEYPEGFIISSDFYGETTYAQGQIQSQVLLNQSTMRWVGDDGKTQMYKFPFYIFDFEEKK